MNKKRHSINKYIEVLNKNDLIDSIILEHEPVCFDGNFEFFEQYIDFLTYDSREVKEGTLFICKGAHFRTEFLEGAKEKGAILYVSEKKYDIEMPCIIVKDIRRSIALLTDLYFNSIWKELTLIGLTGTKGKSTTAFFVKAILDEYLLEIGKKPIAVLSSIENYDGVICEESHLTTPEPIELYRHFENAIDSGIEYLVMEVSSQALKYDRTFGIEFDIGAFLNIGLDHISDIEHSDFDDYFSSKLKLFSQSKTMVLNKNSEHLEKLLETAENSHSRLVCFGNDTKCDLVCLDIEPNDEGISFLLKCDDFEERFEIGLRGLFNVENALAAIAIAREIGVPLEYIKSGLKKAKVSGRMEIFKNKTGDINVIVDYAHNKMSFTSLFDSLQNEFKDKKIDIVFGCPGKKALSRRKELGEIAGRYADMSYITEEDAGEENVLDICNEIASHIEKVGGCFEIVPDRELAIKKAIERSNKDRIVLITGKGRETRQKRGNEYIDTPSDVELVTKYLNNK